MIDSQTEPEPPPFFLVPLDVFLVLIVIGATFVAGLTLGIHWAQSVERAEAVQAHVARWEVDRATGETRFVYGVTK